MEEVKVKAEDTIQIKAKIIIEMAPILEKLTPLKRERVLGYALGLSDKEELSN